MGTPSAQDQLTICLQFDALCRKAIKYEKINWVRHNDFIQKHETAIDDYIAEQLYVEDEYSVENEHFIVLNYDIEVKNELLAAKLKELTDRRRDVVLMAYYLGMSDVEIGNALHLVKSTVNEHKKKGIQMLRLLLGGLL